MDEQAELVTLESNQLVHLQLWKRYYAEAAKFMWMVEGAMCVFFASLLISPCFLPHSHCFPPIKKIIEERVADATLFLGVR